MRKTVIIGAIIFTLILTLSQGEVMNMLLTLMLAGVIPGTHYIVPYWAMMALYCGLITLIVSVYTEQSLQHRRASKAAASRKSRMPGRRYSHI